MKKSRLLIAVLAATMFVLAAFGLIACDKDAGDLGGATTPAGVYTITLNYGEGSGTLSTTVTANGKIVTLPTPSAPNGKKFDAWYDAATGGNKVTTSTTFTKNSTIYARYTDNSTPNPTGVYTVTFNYNGGTGTPASAQTTDGKLTLTALPTPTTAPEGKEFDAWYDAATGGNKVDLNKVYTEPTTIYAQYTGGGQQEEEYGDDGLYSGFTNLGATLAVNDSNEDELMITGLVLSEQTDVTIVYNGEAMSIVPVGEGDSASGGALVSIAADGMSVTLAAGEYTLYYSFKGEKEGKLWVSKKVDQPDDDPNAGFEYKDLTATGAFLVGKFTSKGMSDFAWGSGFVMTDKGNGVYELKNIYLYVGDIFKVRLGTNDNKGHSIWKQSDQLSWDGGNANVLAGGEGYYTITIDTSAGNNDYEMVVTYNGANPA